MSDCSYIAGAGTGNDLIRIQDQLTGQKEDITINVDPDSKLEGLPEVVLLPVGATYTSEATGGSNVFSYSILSGDIVSVGESLTATEPGESMVKVIDRFAGFEQTLQIVATNVISPPRLPDG